MSKVPELIKEHKLRFIGSLLIIEGNKVFTPAATVGEIYMSAYDYITEAGKEIIINNEFHGFTDSLMVCVEDTCAADETNYKTVNGCWEVMNFEMHIG